MLNLSVLLENSAQKYADKTAFTFMDSSLSFAQINGAANQVANALVSLGIRPGDKIALSCFNLPYFPIIYNGILKAGATVVPLSVLLKADEIHYHLENSDAKAYFSFTGTEDLPMGQMGHEGFQKTEACEHFFMIMPKSDMPSTIEGVETLGTMMRGQSPIFDTVETKSSDTAVIIYTSGTTGRPKGAELTHSNLFANTVLSADLIDCKPEDTLLIVLPLFHIFAMTVMMNAGLYRGATSILLPRFDAEGVLSLMHKHKVTIFAGVPTMYWGLNSYLDTNEFNISTIKSTLKTCASGGASLPVPVLEKFEKTFDLTILEGYGMSEGSPVVTFNQLDVGRKIGSVGTPVWGVQVKLVNEEGEEVPVGEKGELLYKGHNVMKGYYKNPEATARTIKNGWLHSGDIAVKDEDGFYFIVDRTKDMIIRGGLNVYPREVEEVMMKHPAVSMVAVIGVPDDEKGEEIKAFVLLNEGQTTTEEELTEYTKGNIAAYKYPRIIEITKTLPTSATGKILKKELRKL
ncbi:long-chain fatty acid--CoA ligase [Maribacter algarum]|uniref:Long-chain fatty acid--CoA ligase n=1 Tax=Maribacter algarum (ex Zhang et al. 2020) TaxID=2578118 RepID=A0A5S3PUX5_9FLAO|nr:long-chain fatty acid--CoA ligase [Maribacter algarum]TMM56748.1 long-chain fatty acid--CoA ligase [Maribacter algarum]